MQNIKPVGERVIIKKIELEQKTVGGIYIPPTANDPRQTFAWLGEVLFVGPGKTLDNGVLLTPDVKPGDKVLVPKYIETTLNVDGEEIAVVKESDLLGVLED